MRIPHIINNDTFTVYSPAKESLEIIGEDLRTLYAEDFEWNKDHIPPLTDFCVETLAKNFEQRPVLDPIPCEDWNYLLEILSVDLPLECAINNLDDEYYWERRFQAKFGNVMRRKLEGWTWKSTYLERHIQDVLEQAQPQYNDEENMDDLLNICSPFIRRVFVTQLQCWKPPLTMDKEDIPEVYPIDHIDFGFIFRKLPLLSEFDLMYGMNEVGEDFTWDMFKLSVQDCTKLGKALLELKQLKIFRLHRSKIEYKHCQALMQGLIRNRTLVELDLSNCEIGDDGALCVAKVLGVHPTLKKLILTNNRIKQKGAEGIGFTMNQPDCAQLTTLVLRLNPLEHAGTMGILRAVVRCEIPEELSLSGCLFDDETTIRICQVIKMNESIKSLDISNNWFGVDGGQQLVDAVRENKTLEWLDVRETDISAEQLNKVNTFLVRNRTGNFVEEVQEVEQDDENVVGETSYKSDEDTSEHEKGGENEEENE